MTACYVDEDVEIDVATEDDDAPWVTVYLNSEETTGDVSLLLGAAEARMRGVELIVAADRAEQRIIQLETEKLRAARAADHP